MTPVRSAFKIHVLPKYLVGHVTLSAYSTKLQHILLILKLVVAQKIPGSEVIGKKHENKIKRRQPEFRFGKRPSKAPSSQ